jgi:hypothetical protein
MATRLVEVLNITCTHSIALLRILRQRRGADRGIAGLLHP